MYGWGRDAPGMHLPDGAGFSIGPRTGIRTAVLQVQPIRTSLSPAYVNIDHSARVAVPVAVEMQHCASASVDSDDTWTVGTDVS